MKTRSIGSIALALSLLSAPHSQAMFDGSGAHGGDSIRLPDDTVILADPFLIRTPTGDLDPGADGTRFDLHPDLVTELKGISQLLQRYGCGDHWCAFIDGEVLNPETEYYFVDKLDNPNCDDKANYRLPPGATLEPKVACTMNGRTYVQADLFKKMNLREQAKTLIHERLRTIKAHPSLNAIADFTTGVGTLLQLQTEQQAGQWRDLTDGEIASIQALQKRMGELRLASNEWLLNYQVLRQGGGLLSPSYSPAEILGGAGIGSRIECKVKSAPSSRIVDTTLACSDGADLSENTEIRDSWISTGQIRLASGASIRASSIQGDRVKVINGLQDRGFLGLGLFQKSLPIKIQSEGADLWLAEGSRIEESQITNGDIELSKGSEISKSFLTLTYGSIALADRARLAATAIRSLSESPIVGKIDLQLGTGTQIELILLGDVFPAVEQFSQFPYEFPLSHYSMNPEYSRKHRRAGDQEIDAIATGNGMIRFAAGAQIVGQGEVCTARGSSLAAYRADSSPTQDLAALKRLCAQNLVIKDRMGQK